MHFWRAFILLLGHCVVFFSVFRLWFADTQWKNLGLFHWNDFDNSMDKFSHWCVPVDRSEGEAKEKCMISPGDWFFFCVVFHSLFLSSLFVYTLFHNDVSILEGNIHSSRYTLYEMNYFFFSLLFVFHTTKRFLSMHRELHDKSEREKTKKKTVYHSSVSHFLLIVHFSFIAHSIFVWYNC